MVSREWLKYGRLLCGFLVAPAIAPVSLILLLILVVGGCRAECPVLGPMFLQGIIHSGIPTSYACAILIAVPYVLWMRSRRELDFWAVMAPIFGLILPLFGLLFVIGVMADLVVGVIVLAPLPGIVLAGLCFYFIAVWTPRSSYG